ncbi:O-antigen ligase family protein [Thermopirellula anaerolimosa]
MNALPHFDLVFLVGLAATAMAVWGGLFAARVGPAWTAAGVIVTAIFFGYPFVHWDVSPIPVTIDRLLWVVMVVQMVWRLRPGNRSANSSASRVEDAFRERTGALGLASSDDRRGQGVSLGESFPRWSVGRFHFHVPGADWVPYVWVGYLAFSAAVTAATGGDVQAAMSRWLFYYALPLGVYSALRTAQFNAKQVRGVLAACVVLGCYLTLIALFETTGARSWVFPRYIASPDYAEFFGRARGPLLNPIGNGVLLLLAWSAAWALWPDAAPRGRVVLIAAGCFLAIGLACTLTRSVWIAAGAAALWLLAGMVPARLRRRTAATFVALAIVSGVLLSGRVLELKRDRDLSASAAAESVRLRPILAAVAFRMAGDRPLFGFGLGQYDRAKLFYLSEREGPYPLERARPYTQHNVFLSLLVETGGVGLAGFLLMLALWFRDAWRTVFGGRAGHESRCAALLLGSVMIAYVVNGMFHDMSIIPQVHLVLFAAAGFSRSVISETTLPERSPAECRPLPLSGTIPAAMPA